MRYGFRSVRRSDKKALLLKVILTNLCFDLQQFYKTIKTLCFLNFTFNFLSQKSSDDSFQPRLPQKTTIHRIVVFCGMGIRRTDSKGPSKQTCQWHVCRPVAFPQKSESVLPHQKKARKSVLFSTKCACRHEKISFAS